MVLQLKQAVILLLKYIIRMRQKCMIIVLMVSLVAVRAQQQEVLQCSPSFTLPNILKDQVSLQYNGGSEQSYSYLFFSAMFSGPPVIAYSISELSIEQANTALNFYLKVQINDMYIYFYFNSPNYKWTIAVVTFCITSRSDIVVSNNAYSNLIAGRNTTFNFPIDNPQASIDAKSTHLIYIVGMYANYTGDMAISVNGTSLSASTAFIVISVGARVSVTNISILSIIYNPTNGQFVSNSGTLGYKSFTSQYFNLFNNFVPIYYVITGINSFTFNTIFSYKLSLINSSVLYSSSTNTFSSISISYFTIGAPMKTVCGDCDNYVYNGNCLNECTSPAYPFIFPDGGKACLICDPIVGQMLNSLAKGCSCLPGYQLISPNQCLSSQPSLICSGINVIQNGTSCICSPGTYNISGQCGTCPVGQIYQNGICQNPNINCPPQSVYNQITQSCTCIPGFFSISGFCVECPTGTVYNGISCVTTTCKDNEVLVNNSCVCDSQSVYVGQLCVKCAVGTFSNKGKTCDNCINNCLKCLNGVTCSQCKDGFYFDFPSLSCFNPNIPSTPKIVSIKSGFPIYTLQGIITDFTINSNMIGYKSKSDLMKMVSMRFDNPNTTPFRIFYSQNPNQMTNIRLAFYYQGLIPLNTFNVTFSFSDNTLDLQQNTTVTYQYTSQRLKYSGI